MTDERVAADPSRRGAARPAAGRRPGSALLWLAEVAAAAAVVYLVRGLLLPFFLAVVLAYLLNPLVARVEAFGIRRSIGVTGLFVLIVGTLVGGGLLVGPRVRGETMTLADNLPSLTARLEKAIDGAIQEVAEASPALRRFLPAAHRGEGWLERLIEERAGNMAELLGHVGTVAFVMIFAPLFAFFFLRDGGRMVTYLIDRMHPAHIETTVAVWCEIDRIIGRYLRGLALEGITVGILSALGLWAIGVPYPLLLGAFAALVNPLPYLGSLFSLAAAGVVSLAQGQGLRTVGGIIVLYLVIRLVDDIVIVPVLIGGSVHLHPMLVIVSIIVGEQALGLLGMVIAVPTVTVIKEIARLLLEHQRTLARSHLPVAVRPSQIAHYVC